MDEPIKGISGSWYVIGHDFSESLIIGNHEKVHHNDIAKMKFVNHIWNAHITEGIEDYESCFRVSCDIILDFDKLIFRVLKLSNWEKDNLDGIFVCLEKQYFFHVVNWKNLHLRVFEAFQSYQLTEEGFKYFDELVYVNLMEVIYWEDLG